MTLLTNCGPLSASRYVGMQNGTMQRFRQMFAVCVDDVCHTKTGRASLKYRYLVKHIFCVQQFVFGNGSNIVILIKPKSLDTGKSYNGHFWRSYFPFRAQLSHSAFVARTSLATCSQYYVLSNVFPVRRCHGCLAIGGGRAKYRARAPSKMVTTI